MDWLVPALVGAVFGTVHYLVTRQNQASMGVELPVKH